MTAGQRLADAIGAIIETKLSAGLGFLRVPEIVSPFPIVELLRDLRDLSDARFAVFLPETGLEESSKVTTKVHEAILWRNDASMTESLVIIGDLERDRAAGLASVPTVTAGEIRQMLMERLIGEAKSASASAKTIRLLDALKSDRLTLDLQYLADYCDSLVPSLGKSDLADACSSLWRLKLLPDKVSADIDARRLRENLLRVTELRQSDATSIQRLIRQLSEQGAGNYEALRRFASTGRREFLETLQLDAVRDALRSARAQADDEDAGAGADTSGRTERTQFLDAVRSGTVDEGEFLSQLLDEREDDTASVVSFAGSNLDWERVSDAQLAPLIEDAGSDLQYPIAAGSLERMPVDEPDPLPGRGEVVWGDLRLLADELAVLEESAGVETAVAPSAVLQSIIKLREDLLPYVTDVPREGVRLFLAAPSIGSTAEKLVGTWVEFWQAMDVLRNQMDDVGELISVGRRLALTDTRVVEQGTSITAYMLPLHPMVLEPRVRAAAMFREHPELDQEFFQIVATALDPAVPSIKLPVDDTTYDLGYSGQFRGLPQYERRAQQFHSPDVVRALQDVIDRFVNVHPYARLSLRAALVDPTAETAKQLLKWLANVDPAKRQRVALDVYVVRESLDEISAKLAEAQEELVSAEIASSRFEYSVEPLARLDDLHGLLNHSDRSPHVLCLFDPAEVAQNATPIANLTPVLGALVNEWEFGARASKEATPFIRPRTGSSSLNEFLTAQARLLGIDSVGATQRTPLLPSGVLVTLAAIAPDTSWVVVAQGASALVAPPSIGAAELLGRASSGSHTAYVYSETPALVLEPVLAYLQQYAYLQSDVTSLTKFVLGTIRLALPEGLLGFYKRVGSLSAESVLGRLGFAAVVAHLQESAEDPNDLIVSLDTEGARRWLGLRDGVARRADLIRFLFSEGQCRIEAIEIKTRSGALAWGGAVPEPVIEALQQVDAMRDLLQQIFLEGSRDQLTASRREILKRQVFLEALHQWEPLRERDPASYRKQIAGLNELFANTRDASSMPVELVKRIFVATPGDDGASTSGVSRRMVEGVEVTQLGLDWFRNLLVQQPGSSIELDPGLLDLLDLSSEEDEHAVPGNGAHAKEQVLAEVPDVVETTASAHEQAPVTEPASDPISPAQTVTVDSGTGVGAAGSEDVVGLLKRLQASFKARNVPYISVSAEDVVVGPSVIQVPIRLELGSRTAQLESQADDIARDLGVQSFRTTNLSGKPGFVLAEVPRSTRQIPDVTSLVRPDLAYPALAVGAGLDFTPFWQCLDEFPHLLIAGKTGSGKSVLIRSLLWQLTRLYTAEELGLVLIGPKAADYMDFIGAPHFRSPGDIHLRADGAIDLLREIVEVRYPAQQAVFDEYARGAMQGGDRISNLRELMAHAARAGQVSPLRPFVVIVDEFVELLDSAPSARKEFEALIARFSRLFRYIGGTMIAATQRPSVRSITGDIKANFRPLALRVERSVDSRVILDENGAEQLIGQGDSLYKADGGLVRLQGYSALGTYLTSR